MTNENRPSYLVEIKSRGVKHKRSTYDVYANRVILTLTIIVQLNYLLRCYSRDFFLKFTSKHVNYADRFFFC